MKLTVIVSQVTGMLVVGTTSAVKLQAADEESTARAVTKFTLRLQMKSSSPLCLTGVRTGVNRDEASSLGLPTMIRCSWESEMSDTGKFTAVTPPEQENQYQVEGDNKWVEGGDPNCKHEFKFSHASYRTDIYYCACGCRMNHRWYDYQH